MLRFNELRNTILTLVCQAREIPLVFQVEDYKGHLGEKKKNIYMYIYIYIYIYIHLRDWSLLIIRGGGGGVGWGGGWRKSVVLR